jgi:hypothetical protein
VGIEVACGFAAMPATWGFAARVDTALTLVGNLMIKKEHVRID